MESKRQHKYARQILKDLNEVFQKDPRHFFGDNFVTVTGVEVAVDLSLARVYFSVMPSRNGDEVIERLDHLKSEVRRNLGNKIGKYVRKIPELAFFNDSTEKKASRMDQLIDSLDIPPPDDDPGDNIA